MGRQDPAGQRQFEKEMKETVRLLYNHPSIVTWVIFNEGWGQFQTKKMTDIVRAEDPYSCQILRVAGLIRGAGYTEHP